MSIANEIAAARTTFTTLVSSALDRLKAGGLETTFAQRFTGEGSAVTITMAGAMPAFAAWEGDAVFGGFREYSITCPFGRQKAGVALKREQVAYDKTGMVGQKLANFTSDVGYLYEKLVIERLVANPTCLDGVALLSNTHPFGDAAGTVWDNLTTDALSFTAYDAARAVGEAFTDEAGEPLNLNYDTIIVPPNLRRTALEIANAEDRPVSVSTVSALNGVVGATGITNVYKGDLTVIVSPRMTASKWIMMDSRYKPIGLVVWRDPEAHVTDDMSGEIRQRRDDFLYGIEADVRCVGLQPWGVYGNL